MDVATIEVAQRNETGKGAARKLRLTGKIPGILYGEGEPPQAILLDATGFETLRRTGAHHRLLDLQFGAGSAGIKALVREIQIHPVSRHVEHVDLQRVSMLKRVHVTVRVVLLGKPEGVKNQGGILEHHLREVVVECLPTEIPEQIELDVSALVVGQALHLSDLVRPGLVVLGHPETTVATVSLPAAERSTEEVAAEAAALAAAAEPAVEGAEGEQDKEKGAAGKEKGAAGKEKVTAGKEKEKGAGKEKGSS